MSRFLRLVALALALLPLSVGARTISDFFASEPGKIFPLLTRTHRLDMVDYYNSGQQVALINNLAGESELVELDSAYLRVKTSGSRTVEMQMRRVGKDTVITVIETVMVPAPDSRLTQWNVHWQQYTSEKLFAMPGIDDFMVRKMPRELRLDLQDAMIFPLVKLSFAGDGHDTIEASHSLEQFLAPSEYKRYTDYLRPSLSYRFNGFNIKPVKQ